MRLVLATIASACSIAVLIDTPRRELEEELKQQWQEYREHTGEIPAFPATSENLRNSFQSRLDTKRKGNYTPPVERKVRETQTKTTEQGAHKCTTQPPTTSPPS